MHPTQLTYFLSITICRPPRSTLLPYTTLFRSTIDSAQREASPLLNNLRDKGIDGIFAPNESSASGMLNAMRSLGLNKKVRSEEHTSELQSHSDLVCRLLLEKKKREARM